MNSAILVVALLSGLFTLVFILDGVRRVFTGARAIGIRLLLVTTLLSLLSGAFAVWQFVLVVQQFSFR